MAKKKTKKIAKKAAETELSEDRKAAPQKRNEPDLHFGVASADLADGQAGPVEVTRSPSPATITLELPIGPPDPAGYLPRKIETRLDSASPQPLALRRIYDGMRDAHEQLDSGKHVDSYAECMRRVLELAAKAMGVPRAIVVGQQRTRQSKQS